MDMFKDMIRCTHPPDLWYDTVVYSTIRECCLMNPEKLLLETASLLYHRYPSQAVWITDFCSHFLMSIHPRGQVMAASPPPLPPKSCDEFEVALMCALPLEGDIVESLFDYIWQSSTLLKAPWDTNVYTQGMIGSHNVVLAWTPGMGKSHAASVAASCRSTFRFIKIVKVI